MATTKFVNRARMLTSTTGTGSSVTLTTAVDGYFTLGEAGLQNGDVVDYIIEQGADFEIQHDQTYSDDGMGTVTLSRGTPAASKVGGSAGTSQIELNGTAQVAIVAVAKSLDVSTFTQKSSPAADDLLWGYDSSVGERAKFLLSSLFPSAPANVQIFTNSGTYTPTSGMKNCLVIATGGGGGGGGARATNSGGCAAGGPGGAGATGIGFYTAAQIGASQSITIGAGGSGGAGSTNSDGGDGGDTTFGSLITAGGGDGGEGVLNTSGDRWQRYRGALGGTSVGANIANIPGGDSMSLSTRSGGRDAGGGVGGASFWGSGGRGGVQQEIVDGNNSSMNGSDGRAPGSGGGGGACGANTNASGGNGADGIVLIIEFF